jgi:hypothetical protein
VRLTIDISYSEALSLLMIGEYLHAGAPHGVTSAAEAVKWRAFHALTKELKGTE